MTGSANVSIEARHSIVTYFEEIVAYVIDFLPWLLPLLCSPVQVQHNDWRVDIIQSVSTDSAVCTGIAIFWPIRCD
jgi:hypothetical protein